METPDNRRERRRRRLAEMANRNNDESKDNESLQFAPLPASDLDEQPHAVGQGPSQRSRSNDLALQPMSSPEESRPSANLLPIHMPLSPEQAELVKVIMGGRNVFYTGSAGCGKSTVLKASTTQLRAQGKTVHIIAPTGIASLEIDGQSAFVYAGWTPQSFKKNLDNLKTAAGSKYVKERLRSTDVLVIDEISMLENNFFGRLNIIMKEARDAPDKAFGGVQLVVTGDFHQLPPVRPFAFCYTCGSELTHDYANNRYTCGEHGHFYDADKWAFKSEAWKECNFVYFSLNTIYRQIDEPFTRMLQKVRVGDHLTEGEIDLLMNHESNTENAVRLYSTRREARRVNDEQYSQLETESHEYTCIDDFKCDEKDNLQFKRERVRLADDTLLPLINHAFEPSLKLKKGMPVVLLVNLDLGRKLCNGSQGVIVGFEHFDQEKLPRAEQRKEDAALPNIIHGEYAKKREFQIKKFIEQATKKVWPIVKFHNGEVRTIYAYCSIECLGNEEPYAILSRTQIPLAEAWAITIHKSQSLTMDKVIVDLSRVFLEGQSYVALSRVRRLEDLKIEGDLGDLAVGNGGNSEVRKFHEEVFGASE